MFPAEKDPSGGNADVAEVLSSANNRSADPQTWTETELRRWLRAVSIC